MRIEERTDDGRQNIILITDSSFIVEHPRDVYDRHVWGVYGVVDRKFRPLCPSYYTSLERAERRAEDINATGYAINGWDGFSPALVGYPALVHGMRMVVLEDGSLCDTVLDRWGGHWPV